MLRATRISGDGPVANCRRARYSAGTSKGRDIAEECWRIVDPVLAAWADDKEPMEEYPAGSSGPRYWRTTVDEDDPASPGCDC